MITRVTHILPMTLIRRTRLMPANGRVIVRVGQKVAASDVIGEAVVNSGHLALDIPRSLGVTQEAAEGLIVRKSGEQVSEGDIIAGPVGSLFPRTVHAPKSGRIVAISNGLVLIEFEGTPLELRAGLSGVVTEVIEDRGVIIENYGALIQGVWGNNHVEAGIMIAAAQTPDDKLTPNRLDVGMRGAIVFAGICSQAEALHSAAEIPVRGLILASLDPDLIPLANKLTFPILVLGGFGKVPMDSNTFKILYTNEKREVSVNACDWPNRSAPRPEIIIPLVAVNELPVPRDSDIFAPGQTVRVIQSPYNGRTATIISLVPGLTNFPSGFHLPAASLHLENGEVATLPLVNLEIIG
jgi:hypothetical protein